MVGEGFSPVFFTEYVRTKMYYRWVVPVAGARTTTSLSDMEIPKFNAHPQMATVLI